MRDSGVKHSVQPSMLHQTASVVRAELREIFTDGGVLLIMLFAIFIYTTLYGVAYGSEVLREVPIAVVDMSHTPSSRRLTTALGEGASTQVKFVAQDIEEVRRLLYEREIYGAVYIPADYEERLVGGKQAAVAIYCDASYFLIYREAFEQIVATLTATGAMAEFRRLVAQGMGEAQAMAVTEPVIYESHTLFNPYLGYGTFVMPAIIIIIIQQTLLMSIGIIGATKPSKKDFGKFHTTADIHPSIFALMAGKTTAYFMVSGAVASLALTLPYYLLGYPMLGSVWTVVAVIVPYILACTMLGIALSTLFRHREEPIMWLLWSSIPILMLSGVSYPTSAMPEPLAALGALFPSTHAVEAFLRVRDMGASVAEVAPSIAALWIQTAIYGALALVTLAHRTKKARLPELLEHPRSS